MYLTTVIKAKNGWLKYDFTVVQEIYYPLALFMGCGVVERHLEMAQPTKKLHLNHPGQRRQRRQRRATLVQQRLP